MRYDFQIKLLLWLAVSTYAHAQELLDEHAADSLAHPTATLSILSNISDVIIFIDSTYVGTAPLCDYRITEGTYIARFVHPDASCWFHPTLKETIIVHPQEAVDRFITFPRIYYITSDPYAAEVKLNDSLLGRTPYVLSTFSNNNLIKVSKSGYEEAILPLPENEGGLYVALNPRTSESAAVFSPIITQEQAKNLAPVYFSAAAAVLSGIVAAFNKIEADTYYNEYLKTGDAGVLNRVHNYDRTAGIALVTSEISILALTYFLLSR